MLRDSPSMEEAWREMDKVGCSFDRVSIGCAMWDWALGQLNREGEPQLHKALQHNVQKGPHLTPGRQMSAV